MPACSFSTNLGNATFEELGKEAGPAIMERHSSRGCAFGDFDNDGDIDILIVNMNEPPSLLRNDIRGTNHWLKVKLVGTLSNRSANWRARCGALWREDTSASGDKPVELLFSQ